MTQHTTSLDTRPKNYLGSTLLFIGIFTTATLAGIFILLFRLLSFNAAYRVGQIWCQTVLNMANWFCGIRYEIEGIEHLATLQESGIILCNHQSAWETLALRALLPYQQTELLKRSLTWFPIWGWALAALKTIAIDRDKPREALRLLLSKGTDNLQQGLWIVVFPEGTRTAAGQVKKFNAGGAMLAHHTERPVIPIAHNAGDVWPRYSFLKYQGVIRVKIGAPIISKGRKAADINNEAEHWIRSTVAQITTTTNTENS